MTTSFTQPAGTEPFFTTREKSLLVTSTSGLCNRLLTLTGSVRIARETKRNLILYWPCNWNVHCPFQELFENPIEQANAWHIFNLLHTQNRVTVYQSEPDSNVNRSYYRSIERNDDAEMIIIKGWVAPAFKDEYRSLRKSSSSKSLLRWVAAFKDGYKSRLSPEMLARPFLRELVPASIIRSRIEHFRSLQGAVGVHIRHGEPRQEFLQSRLEDFIAIMRGLLERKPETRFFLATDYEPSETMIRDAFPGRVLVQPKRFSNSHVKRDREGMMEAVVDLYLLAKTKAIVGNHSSTFSQVAALLGNGRLIIAKKENAEPKLSKTLTRLLQDE